MSRDVLTAFRGDSAIPSGVVSGIGPIIGFVAALCLPSRQVMWAALIGATLALMFSQPTKKH